MRRWKPSDVTDELRKAASMAWDQTWRKDFREFLNHVVAAIANELNVPAPGSDRHEWDRDGERCVKCGDKDWMADDACRPATDTPEAAPQQTRSGGDAGV